MCASVLGFAGSAAEQRLVWSEMMFTKKVFKSLGSIFTSSWPLRSIIG